MKLSARPTSRRFSHLTLGLFVFVVVLSTPLLNHAGEKQAVTIEKTEDALNVAIDGKPFFTYQYNTNKPIMRRPLIHPLYGPGGQVITQMGEVPGQRKRHFHHTGLWISHQKFTQGNNWQMDANPRKSPRRFSSLLHRKFAKVTSGKSAQFVEHLQWDSVDGKTILLDETRTVTIPHRPATRRVIDFEILLQAKKKAVTLQRTPYHILAVRVLNSMVPAFNKQAVITNSEGQKNPRTGTPAKWIDVSGPVGDSSAGVTLFNHPQNVRHPTPCLNFANQTIGLSPTHLKSYTIAPGNSLRLRFRVLVHAGRVADAEVANEYADYCKNVK